jgi:hypothetical protein
MRPRNARVPELHIGMSPLLTTCANIKQSITGEWQASSSFIISRLSPVANNFVHLPPERMSHVTWLWKLTFYLGYLSSPTRSPTSSRPPTHTLDCIHNTPSDSSHEVNKISITHSTFSSSTFIFNLTSCLTHSTFSSSTFIFNLTSCHKPNKETVEHFIRFLQPHILSQTQ